MTKWTKIHEKFKTKFPEHIWELDADGKFVDKKAQECFEFFKAGWMSHPQFKRGIFHVIGKETADGIEFAIKPRIHVSVVKATEECRRLAKEHNANFHLFSGIMEDPDDVFRKKIIAGYSNGKQVVSTEIQSFTLYWKHGGRTIIHGATVDEAFSRAGYGAGALAAVDWYDRGVTDTHEWVAEIKSWVKRDLAIKGD